MGSRDDPPILCCFLTLQLNKSFRVSNPALLQSPEIQPFESCYGLYVVLFGPTIAFPTDGVSSTEELRNTLPPRCAAYYCLQGHYFDDVLRTRVRLQHFPRSAVGWGMYRAPHARVGTSQNVRAILTVARVFNDFVFFSRSYRSSVGC